MEISEIQIENKNSTKLNTSASKVLSSGYKLEFQIEETVYLKTDKEQKPRIVTGMTLRPFNSITYGITESTFESWHYGFEISSERDVIFATSN